MMNEQAAPAPKEEMPAPEGGGAEVGEKLVLLSESLNAISQGMGQSDGIPPEAMEAIQMASSAYNKFLSIVGKKMGIAVPEAPGMKGGVSPADSGGGRGAVPADMPTGRGPGKAVPAM